MIKTKDIAFSYQGKVNFNFPDIQIESGETLLITGGSGKGKTTLLHLLGGLDRPDSGKDFFEQKNIFDFNNKDRKIVIMALGCLIFCFFCRLNIPAE